MMILMPFQFAIRIVILFMGRTFPGRYLLVLVRVLSSDEVLNLGFESGANVIRIITVREMNSAQRKMYNKRRR